VITGAAPIVAFAFWLGLAVAAMTVIMLIVTLTMRRLSQRRASIHARAVALWRPVILAEAAGTEAPLPALTERNRSGFIRLWNEVHEPLRGQSTDHLARIARTTGLEQQLYQALQARSFHDRVVALIALGHVRSRDSFSHVARFLDDASPIMSLCAARALMQIDPGQAISMLVPRIMKRADWSQGSIAAILAESEAALIAAPLAAATRQAALETALETAPDVAPRMIRFLAGVSAAAAAPVIRESLRTAADEQLISTCLLVISYREDLDCVRPILSHHRWHIRMQAAATLGRLGAPGDEQQLIALLGDPQWWVRYRAAQALLNLEFIGSERLRAIQAAQSDPYAQDIITQVLAERAIGAVL
jgi:HEAT repeat protein